MSPRRAVRAALLVLALSAPAAPAARAADAPDAYRVPKPTERGLKNQMKVYIFEDHRLPMVSYRFVLRAGSAHEPAEKAGLANLMLHVLRQGSETMDADSLARRLDAMGGSIDGVTGRDYMALTGRFLSRDWRAGLDVLSDLVQHPAFRQDDFERQREQVLAGIRAALEQDATTASRHVEALVYGAHPYAHAVTGDASSVSSLTRDDLVAFHGTYVHSNLALLEIVGDVDPQQVMFEIEGQFRDWERGEPPSRPGPALPEFENNRVRLLDHPGAEQAELRIGFDGPARDTPDFFAIQVMNYILGGGGPASRLQRAARAAGILAPGASTVFDMGLDKGAVFASAFTRPESAGRMLDLCLSTIRDFQDKGPTANELAEAKSFLVGSLPFGVQTAQGLAAQWAAVDLYTLGSDYFDRFAGRVDAVTAADVQAAARKYLRTRRLAIVAVGPAAALHKQLEPFGSVEVLDYRSPTGAIPQSRPTQAVPAGFVTPAAVARAREVVAHAVRAHGGEARLAALKDVSTRSTVTLQTPNGAIDGETAMVVRMPDRTRLEMNMLGQRGVQVLSGDSGWLTNGGAVADLSEEQVQAMRAGLKVQVLPLLARLASGQARVGYAGTDVVDGDSVDVVQIIDADAPARAAFSRKSGLLVRLEQEEPAMFGGGRVQMQRLYSDYRDVDGYEVPFRTERLAAGQKVLTDSVTVYQINRGVGDSTFQRPPR